MPYCSGRPETPYEVFWNTDFVAGSSHTRKIWRRENDEMSTAPFLIETIEEENGIKFIVALSTRGEMGIVANQMSKSAINELLSIVTPIYPDQNNLYEIIFENYVLHMTRNESYTSWDNYEIRKGKYFIIFDKSRLLDSLPQIVDMGIMEAYCPKGWKHYGIYCQNHVVDVIAVGEPQIRRLTGRKEGEN